MIESSKRSKPASGLRQKQNKEFFTLSKGDAKSKLEWIAGIARLLDAGWEVDVVQLSRPKK